MNDLTWVEKTQAVQEGDPAKQAMEGNPGWHLLHITGGLHGPIEYVFGWGRSPGYTLMEDTDVINAIQKLIDYWRGAGEAPGGISSQEAIRLMGDPILTLRDKLRLKGIQIP